MLATHALSIPSLPPRLIERALSSGRDRRPRRAQRRDGWTPRRIHTFLDVMARSGSVAEAAGAAGMSRQSAYALRSSPKGEAFDDAWRAALLLAAPRIADEAMERALCGQVEPVYRNGEIWAERHFFDNRFAMRLLRQLDKLAAAKSASARLLNALADDFDTLVGIAAACDDEALDAHLRSLSGRSAETRQTPHVSTLPKAEQAASPISSPGFPGKGDRPKGGGGTSLGKKEEAPPPPFRRSPSPANAGEESEPHSTASPDHFVPAMKLYPAQSFFPPGRGERAMTAQPSRHDRPITWLRRRFHR